MSDEKISSALGIRAMSDIDENEKAEQVPVVQLDVPSKEIVPINPDDDENLQDIELVRQNIASVIDIGKDMMMHPVDFIEGVTNILYARNA